VQPIFELYRIGIKPKHPYVVLAFVRDRFFMGDSYCVVHLLGENYVQKFTLAVPYIMNGYNNYM